jgi:hypothetical protein
MAPAEYVWLRETVRWALEQARFISALGIAGYYPAVDADFYPACYLRDFVYMVEAAPEFIPPADTRALLTLFLTNCREDGLAPEKVMPNGQAVYGCHGPLPVVDSGPFLVKLMQAYLAQQDDIDFLRAHFARLPAALSVLPTEAATGLVWVDPTQPHTAYGFSDTIAKTGQEFYCSLLLFEAWGLVHTFALRLGETAVAAESTRRREQLRNSFPLLWAEEEGMFNAASLDCHQVDVWGSLYACVVGAATDVQRQRIGAWFTAQREHVLYREQIRHIPTPECWQRTIEAPYMGDCTATGHFQNGAYWATPGGWYAELLESLQPSQGVAYLTELVREFQQHGIWECVGPDGYLRLENNISSMALPYQAFKKILR